MVSSLDKFPPRLISFASAAVLGVSLGASVPAAAADSASEIELIKQQLQLLQKRLEKLEAQQTNGALKASQPAGSSDQELAEPVERQPIRSPLQDRVAEMESAVEQLQQSGSTIEPFAGAEFGASFVAVGQHAHDAPVAANQSNSEINYRGDFELALPLGSFDEDTTQGLLYTQLRLGQGEAVNVGVNTFSGSVNSTTFALAGSPADASTVLLAQMWYQVQSQVNWLSQDGQSDQFSLTLGKIDPFVFFDTNPVADDESEYFVNNVFVHNAQLDSGGDIGADQYGFSPGLVLEYALHTDRDNQWTGRFGVFGAGNGSSFDNSLSQPFSIAQLSYEGKAFGDYNGFYSIYAWNNPQSTNAFTNATERHTGFGLSVSQDFAAHATVFARYGHQEAGQVNFDSSVTGGLVLGGSYWNRSSDKMGVAVGGLRASGAYRAANLGAGRSETNLEVFYTWQINENLHVSPHYVHIQNPAGFKNNGDVSVLGLRTKASF